MISTSATATITGARRALGRQLAELRCAANLTQADLAMKTLFSRSTVANVETGRQRVSRQFWARCEELVPAGGALVVAHDHIEAALRQHRTEQAAAIDAEREARIVRLYEHGTSGGSPLIEPRNTPSSAHDIIHRTFLGVSAGSTDADSSAQQDLETRVLDACRLVDRPARNKPLLTLVGGFAGSGKSEFARFLSAVTGWAFLDKDTLTRPLSERLLRSLGADADDRNTSTYLDHVRPQEYRCLMNAAFDNLECCVSTVAASAFLMEFADQAWLQRLANRCAAKDVDFAIVWVRCDPDSMLDYLTFRGAGRDKWKMENWDEYIRSIDIEFRPPWPHFVADNNLNSAVSIADQARDLATRVCRAS